MLPYHPITGKSPAPLAPRCHPGQPGTSLTAKLGNTSYQRFPGFWDDARKRKWTLWGYIDERDVAASCRLALEAPAEAVHGNPAFIIAAADTVMNRPSAELLAEVYPGVQLTREVSQFGTLLAIDRAPQLPASEPAHSWPAHITPSQA